MDNERKVRKGNLMVQVRLPESERHELRHIASKRGMTVTELARKYIRAGAKRDASRINQAREETGSNSPAS